MSVSPRLLNLGLPDRPYQFRQPRWIYVADRDHFQIACTEVHHLKSRVLCRQLIRARCVFLADENRNAMLANAVEQLGHRLVVQVGQVRPIERRARGRFSGKLKLNGILP